MERVCLLTSNTHRCHKEQTRCTNKSPTPHRASDASPTAVPIFLPSRQDTPPSHAHQPRQTNNLQKQTEKTRVENPIGDSPEHSARRLVSSCGHDNRPRRVTKQLRQPQLRESAEVIGQATGEHGDTPARLSRDCAPVFRHLADCRHGRCGSVVLAVDCQGAALLFRQAQSQAKRGDEETASGVERQPQPPQQ